MLQLLKVMAGLIALFFIDVLMGLVVMNMGESTGSLDPSLIYMLAISFMVCIWIFVVYLLSRFARIEPAQIYGALGVLAISVLMILFIGTWDIERGMTAIRRFHINSVTDVFLYLVFMAECIWGSAKVARL